VSFTLASVLGDVAPMLHAATATDAELVFWTSAELVIAAQDALKHLAREVPVFVEQAQGTLPAGEYRFALPQRYVNVITMSAAGRTLRSSTVNELEARSSSWATDTGTAERVVFDEATDVAFIWRGPTVQTAVAAVIARWPDVAQAIQAPDVVADYLVDSVVAKARECAGDASMPEVAEHLRSECEMWRGMFAAYWGGAL
jgi:hypothetical protein